MDHGDDRRADQGTSPGGSERDAPANPWPAGPSGRVRIVGAEPALDATAVVPAVPRDGALDGDDLVGPADGPASVRLTGEPGYGGAEETVEPVQPGGTAVPRAAEGWADSAVLPHWTEPPTGQVPAVLERDRPDGAATGPTWREEHADWEAHDEAFDPSLFAPEEDEELGSLDESGGPDLERRPWEFDLPEPVARGWDDEVTEPVPRVPRGSSEARDDDRWGADDPLFVGRQRDLFSPGHGTAQAGTAERDGTGVAPTAASVPADEEHGATLGTGEAVGGEQGGAPDAVEDVFGTTRGRPTGTVPVGRLRRGGMRTPRVRAKRPEDADSRFDEPPLAASPPGAAVTAVPGAGRRRGGIADLAAADREEARRGGADGGDEHEGERDPTAPWTRSGRPGADPVDGEDRLDRLGGGAGGDDEAPVGGEDGAEPGDGSPSPGEVGPRSDVEPGVVEPPAARGRARHRRGAWDVGEEVPLSGRGARVHAPAPGAEAVQPRRLPPVHEPGEEPAGRRRDEPEERRGGGVATRIVTGVIAAAVALAAFAGGAVTSLVLVTVVVTFAAGEAFGALRRAGYRPATLLGLVGTVSLLVGAYTKGPQALPLVLVLLVVFSFAWYLFGVDHSPPLVGVASTLLVVGWVSLTGSFAALLLAPSAFPHRNGVAFLLGAIIATVANDVGALTVGAWLGRRPLAPRVSPNKTWEGLIGGTIVTVVVSTGLVGAIHPWTASSAAVLGLVVSVVAPIGDLSESLLKRDLRMKDMGSLLPGHGGVLDRVDAMLFVLPATYYLVRVLNLG